MKKLEELTEQLLAAKKRMQDEGKGAFEEAMKELFDAHPGLVGIRWRQYTPYFNDGDTCTFSVGEPYIQFSDTEAEAGDYEDGYDSYSEWRDQEYRKQGKSGYPVGFKEADEAVGKVFSSIPDDLMLAIFDDHVEVTVTRDGTQIEEYSHD